MELISRTSPILALNPYTGKHVNVAPLFDAMDQLDQADPGGGSTLQRVIARTIRHINLTGSEHGPLTSLNYDLYRLEDMFASMIEVDQSK